MRFPPNVLVTISNVAIPPGPFRFWQILANVARLFGPFYQRSFAVPSFFRWHRPFDDLFSGAIS
jgi:hypothetical protein